MACGPAGMLPRMQNQCFRRSSPSLSLSFFPNIRECFLRKKGELATQLSFLCRSSTFSISNTAILSCRHGPLAHEKSWKMGLGPLDLKSWPSPHCWVQRNSRESLNFHFGPVEGGFRTSRRRFFRTENDDESSIAAYKLQLTPPACRRDSRSARRDSRLFFQAFQPCVVISWRISTNEPSLDSLRSQQSDGAIFVPVSPREWTIAPFLRSVLTLSAQFPRIRTRSGQINLYKGEIAVE